MNAVTIAQRVAQVRERIAAACMRAGRDPSDVTIVAASKSRTPDEILEAYRTGILDFGENYWQDARTKIEACLPNIRWHFIGVLQSNKAKYVARHFQVLQSLHSLELAVTLSKALTVVDKKLQVLVEVNVDREHSKSGVPPEQALELAAEVGSVPRLELCGLMTMGAAGVSESELRTRFRMMRALFEQLPPQGRRILSMGMTSDYEVAVEEGATMVRIGTAIFGPRPQ
ncbi:MAG: YggS family pyridoxal phosphate-dependent enzyme [Fimbriimonadia bacterium]|jgi:hypothetical protein